MVPVGRASLCISSVRSSYKNPENSSCCICIVVVFAWNKCENALFKKPSTREQLLQRNSGLAHRVFSALSPPLLVSQEEAGRWTISPFQHNIPSLSLTYITREHNIPSLSLTYITRELRTIKAGRVSWNQEKAPHFLTKCPNCVVLSHWFSANLLDGLSQINMASSFYIYLLLFSWHLPVLIVILF